MIISTPISSSNSPVYPSPKQCLLSNSVSSEVALSALFLVQFCLFDFVFDNPLSLISVAHMYLSMDPFTGEQEIEQWEHPQGRMSFLSQYLSSASSSSIRQEACYAVFGDVALTFGIKYAYYTCSRFIFQLEKIDRMGKEVSHPTLSIAMKNTMTKNNLGRFISSYASVQASITMRK